MFFRTVMSEVQIFHGNKLLCIQAGYIESFHTTGVQANFCRGTEPTLPQKFLDIARKNCYANLQNYFARLTPPTGTLAGTNSVYLFDKYKKIHFGCWLPPEKFSFRPKNNGFAQVGGCSPPAPWLVCLFQTANRLALTSLQQ